MHKQYNSPIDLYSMNNIRKTIEAHTELIAPGVKGINFMKTETPINKRSEVYKLVMEEEHKSAAGSSPSSSHQAGTSSRQVSFEADRATSRSTASSRSHQHQDHQRQHQESVTSTSGGLHHQANEPPSRPPSCYQCGQMIIGHYAKVQDRSLHPHCFNCSTCGTSLKNTGYFTINDKLYCEIHAKQMANVMGIRYDFDAPARQQQQAHQTQQAQPTQSNQWQQHQRDQHQVAPTTASSSIQIASEQQAFSRLQEQQQQHQQYTQHQATLRTQAMNELNGYKATGGQGRAYTIAGPSPSATGSQATISTMFADKSRMTSDESTISSGPRVFAHNESCDLRQQQKQQQSSQSHLSSSMESRATQQQQQQHHQQPGGPRVPICTHCQVPVHGPYVLANRTTWCKPCSQTNFVCCSCRRSLLDVGFIEDGPSRYYCECCYEAYFAPNCSKCHLRIKGDCLNALGKKWHPSCFVCGHCQRPFGNSSFYLEDQVPYCERDWNILFTTKCYSCSLPIEAGDKWVEALARNYHSTCFKCTSCQLNLEGSTFYCKQGRPYCRMHAR